jgi:hypothetical protein
MEINPKLVKGLSGAELHVSAETVEKDTVWRQLVDRI